MIHCIKKVVSARTCAYSPAASVCVVDRHWYCPGPEHWWPGGGTCRHMYTFSHRPASHRYRHTSQPHQYIGQQHHLLALPLLYHSDTLHQPPTTTSHSQVITSFEMYLSSKMSWAFSCPRSLQIHIQFVGFLIKSRWVWYWRLESSHA